MWCGTMRYDKLYCNCMLRSKHVFRCVNEMLHMTRSYVIFECAPDLEFMKVWWRQHQILELQPLLQPRDSPHRHAQVAGEQEEDHHTHRCPQHQSVAGWAARLEGLYKTRNVSKGWKSKMRDAKTPAKFMFNLSMFLTNHGVRNTVLEKQKLQNK